MESPKQPKNEDFWPKEQVFDKFCVFIERVFYLLQFCGESLHRDDEWAKYFQVMKVAGFFVVFRAFLGVPWLHPEAMG
jgi:hypothetical protein